MPGQSSMLHVRVDNDTRERATAALDAMGLTMSEAVRLFLHRVVAEQAFPFELKAPNSETRAGMAEAEEILRSRRARFKNGEELMASLEKPRKNKRTGAREPTPSV
jgi:DNA-damage-inducible protein J